MINGFTVRYRNSSRYFSSNVGGGWPHFWLCLLHELQDVERSHCRCSDCSSLDTDGFETQPRNQQRASAASSSRFFDNSHWGVSGILNYIHFFNSNFFFLLCLRLIMNFNTHKTYRNGSNSRHPQTNRSHSSPRHQSVQEKCREDSNCVTNDGIAH